MPTRVASPALGDASVLLHCFEQLEIAPGFDVHV